MEISILAPQYTVFSEAEGFPDNAAQDLMLSGHHDLISFLGLMQRLAVDLLPIKWQPALEDLGMGGSASISQALLSAETSFAFKRLYLDDSNAEICFKRLVKEALILRHIELINRETLIRLEAYCLHIPKGQHRISPVLIFEKFPLGNLQDFLLSDSACNITFAERLGFCADVGNALACLHRPYIMHGDVKPLNVLVFEQDGKRIVKLADMGDASICQNDETLAFPPESKPWSAPEYHHRGFPFRQAAKMDVYSFGLLCLWVMFGEDLLLLAASMSHYQYYDQSTDAIPSTVKILALLKKEGTLRTTVRDFLVANQEITQEQRSKLNSFYALTLAEDPAARSSDFRVLLEMLGDHRILPSLKDPLPMRGLWANYHPTFDLAGYMLILSLADHRIRVEIVQELIRQYWATECSDCKSHMSLQIALSYHTGYGQPRNLGSSLIWLERSGRSKPELEAQVEYAKILILLPPTSDRIKKLRDQFLFADDVRGVMTVHGRHFSQIKAELAVEVRDMEVSIGETHTMTINMRRTLAGLLMDHGLYKEAADMQEGLIVLLKRSGDDDSRMKVLADVSHTYSLQDRLHLAESYRLEVVEYYTKHLGEKHMGTLGALTNLAHTQVELRRWTEAERNLLYVTAITARKVGQNHRATLAANSILAALYFKQGLLARAEGLQSQVLQARLTTLGETHESTWHSMANLAAILNGQGHFDDAEKLEVKVYESRKKALGPNHPTTLNSMSNLALTYGKLKRLELEESMLKQVLGARMSTLGIGHQDTITTVASLARTYHNQGRLAEAERSERDVVRMRTERFGEGHPSVLASTTHLMWILYDRQCCEEAETVQLENIAAGKTERGESDVSVLRCMSALASMYKIRERLLESLELYRQALQLRVELLGGGHEDTLKTTRDIETVEKLLAERHAAPTEES